MPINAEKDLLLDFSLARISFLTQSEKKLLKNNLDSADSLALLSKEEISCLVGKALTEKVDWKGKQNFEAAKRELEVSKRLKIDFLRYDDDLYPALLKEISNPPYMIFYRGSLDAFSQKSVSVVGTRQISPEGKISAHSFAKDAAEKGYAVVSGLANGVDGFSHKGAIDAYFDCIENGGDVSSVGKTVAVLPCAIDTIYPANHKRLAENILMSGGAIISEYAPLSEFAPWRYVKRNRLIAALSPATVVIEAPNGSGALLTVDYALELNRDVMFHKVCFSESAKKVAEAVKRDLEIKVEKGIKKKSKLESCSERYVEDGAPVIDDFEDYLKCLSELPGTRNDYSSSFINQKTKI